MSELKKVLAIFLAVFGVLLLANTANAKSKSGQYNAEIAEAERLGKIIYEKDIAAWVGTDKMLEDLGQDVSSLPLRGWVTDKDGSRWRVNFIGEKDGQAKIYYQAWTKGKKVKKTLTYKEGIALNDKQMAMWRARQLVAGQEFQQCAKRYNTVVLPYETKNEKFFYVYLFASTTDPTKIVIGGHYRYKVSSDGEKVVSNIAFSNGCMEITKDPKSVMFVVTHLKTNYPQEHYVFINLSHGVALMVSVPKADLMYMINNGKIKEISEP